MGKVSTKLKASAKSPENDEIARLAAVASAKQQFVSSAMDMGWRLALSVLVPVIIGSWLDGRYKTSPSWVLVGLFVAVGLAVMVVTKTISGLNDDKPKRKT